MTAEDAYQFLIAIGEDKDLLTKAQDAGKGGVKAFAQSLGFNIQLEELEAACKKLMAIEDGEVDESDLDGVSGGIGVVTAISAGAALYAVGKAEGWW